MPFVLDASIAACWAFPDEQDPRADVAIARVRIEDAVVPALWWFEVRSILVVNERRQRITEAGTNSFLRELARLRIRVHDGFKRTPRSQSYRQASGNRWPSPFPPRPCRRGVLSASSTTPRFGFPTSACSGRPDLAKEPNPPGRSEQRDRTHAELLPT